MASLPSTFTQGYQPGVTPYQIPQFNGGTVPLTVEPLHQLERSGLSSLAAFAQPQGYFKTSNTMFQRAGDMTQQIANDPMGAANRYIDPRANGAVDNMGNAIGQGLQTLNPSRVASYMNPYGQEVTDRTLAGIDQDQARQEASITAGAGMRGARSFGNSAQAIRMAENDRNYGNLRADTRAKLNYQGFTDATGQFNKEQDRYLQGAGMYGDQANTAQGVFNSGIGAAGQVAGGLAEMGNLYRGLTKENIGLSTGAGTTIREYNQGVANQVGGQIDNRVGMTPSRLSGLASYLGSFKDSQYQYPSQPGTMQKLGGAAMFASQIPGAGAQLQGFMTSPSAYFENPGLASAAAQAFYG